MLDFFVIFVRENPELVIALMGLMLAAISIGIAKRSHRISQENKFYDDLEKTSIFQIDENLKDIERILNKEINSESHSFKLQDILDGTVKAEPSVNIHEQLATLSPYFANYCANLDKYSSNIMPRKQICFNFQEYGNKARRILSLFKEYNYQDISLGFAKLHLQSTKIINEKQVGS